MNIGDFVKQMVAELHTQGVAVPFYQEPEWHELFYKLKSESGGEHKPECIENLRFSWDGPYPKSAELGLFLRGLQSYARSPERTPWEGRSGMQLSDEVVSHWLEQGKEANEGFKEYLQHALEEAKSFFTEASEGDG